jgi:hypothetical protein
LEAALFHWSHREATPEEIARMRVADAEMRGQQELAKIIVAALKSVPDELILGSV